MSAKVIRCIGLAVLLVVCLASTAQSAPFFDAIYAALNGNTRRSYPAYGSSYGNYGYGYGHDYGGSGTGYNGGHREAPRQGKSYKEICRVHNPQSWYSACPY